MLHFFLCYVSEFTHLGSPLDDLAELCLERPELARDLAELARDLAEPAFFLPEGGIVVARVNDESQAFFLTE